MGIYENHWKLLQLRSCKLWCKSVRKKHLFRDHITFWSLGRSSFGAFGVESPHGVGPFIHLLPVGSISTGWYHSLRCPFMEGCFAILLFLLDLCPFACFTVFKHLLVSFRIFSVFSVWATGYGKFRALGVGGGVGSFVGIISLLSP